MSASLIFNTIIGALLLPPLNLILVCMLGLWLRRRHARTGLTLSVAALLGLALLSTQGGARWLAAPLENMTAPLASTTNVDAQAIVVLGGGRQSNAPEYGGEDVPSLTTLGRLRYGARLQRETGLPLLVTGGSPDGRPVAEATLMAQTLRQDFAVPVQWIEAASDNTAQNAQFSARILRQAGIKKVLLVTDALHMPRAVRAFERAGLRVLPAPTVFQTRSKLTLLGWVPSSGGFHLAHYAMHEWLGMLWYRLHSQDPPAFGAASSAR